MKIILTLLLTTIGIGAIGQNVRVDTLDLMTSEHLKKLPQASMIFPIIKTGHIKIDSLINFDLKNKLTSYEYPNESIDSTLIKWANDQIVLIDFNVTYIQNGIVSLNISAESCGAYCSYWTEYYNYSTVTGKPLDISEIIDLSGEFRTTILTNAKSQFKKQKEELKDLLNNPEAELNQETYEWALEYYEDCQDSFDLNSYSIYPDHVEIIKNCYLPNAIKSLSPNLVLKYNNDDIAEYLKIKH